MFDIKFDSEFKAIAFYDEEKRLRFVPPVHEQRYSAVLRCLELPRWTGHFKKIVEFGCAQMKFLILLKSLKGISHILQVDTDEETLNRHIRRAEPLIADYVLERENQLQIDVYCGSIGAENECLLNTDVVIGIEIIEHLYPETLEKVPSTIFGYMKPKIAIFTTPNVECNVLFDMPTKFRHDDHKFEWSRAEFQKWANDICSKYPDYKVAFYGIGQGPPGTEYLGCCSQMALFIRSDFLELTSTTSHEQKVSITCDRIDMPRASDSKEITSIKRNENETQDGYNLKVQKNLSNLESDKDEDMDDIMIDLASTHLDEVDYRLITSCVYKENRDDRSREQKIFDEASYQLGSYMNLDDDYYDCENHIIRVPVKTIFNLVYKYTEDINEFRYVMRKHDYDIDQNDDFLIKPIEDEEDDDYDDFYEASFVSSVDKVGNANDEEENWDDC